MIGASALSFQVFNGDSVVLVMSHDDDDGTQFRNYEIWIRFGLL
jgi:hypothetical protein